MQSSITFTYWSKWALYRFQNENKSEEQVVQEGVTNYVENVIYSVNVSHTLSMQDLFLLYILPLYTWERDTIADDRCLTFGAAGKAA